MTELFDPRGRQPLSDPWPRSEDTVGVRFRSEGRVLILGTGQRATDAAIVLAETLTCCLVTDEATVVPAGVASYLHPGGQLRLEGFLGAFTAVFDGAPEQPDLGATFDPVRPVFDLVLDLGEASAFAREWGPPGYFRPQDEAALAAALVDLPKRVGALEKPKYFHLDASICAHGLPGTDGCSRCLDVCPAEAISSVESKIQVDANLCQGGGACATTCPTGALTYLHPERVSTLERLAGRLGEQLTRLHELGSDERPAVVFLEGGSGRPAAWPEEVIAFEVLEVASVGMETWLSALALGAGRVRILRPNELASQLESALDEQLGYARAILAGLGFAPEVLSWMGPLDDPFAGAGLPTSHAGPPLTSIEAKSKRGVLFTALDALRAGAPVQADILSVPTGAPFGQLRVDAATCTTCLACAFVCPTRALTGGGTIPSLHFTEAACVQCGLCVAACPEDAIEREARLLLHPDERISARVLHADEPFACIACGKPFASAGSVRAVIEKLADHPMFTKTGIDVLKTCDACRIEFLGSA